LKAPRGDQEWTLTEQSTADPQRAVGRADRVIGVNDSQFGATQT